MRHVEAIIVREGQTVEIGQGLLVCVAWARGGKLILGTALCDDVGPLTDKAGLLAWAAAVREKQQRAEDEKQN